VTPEEQAALIAKLSKVSPILIEPRLAPMTIDPKCTVIIGTSSSTDYLRDGTGNQRFWPVSVPCGESALDCDGLHDESAPSHYLCSRRFPEPRGDLSESLDPSRRDETEEME
jgi:hypothetical protein